MECSVNSSSEATTVDPLSSGAGVKSGPEDDCVSGVVLCGSSVGIDDVIWSTGERAGCEGFKVSGDGP